MDTIFLAAIMTIAQYPKEKYNNKIIFPKGLNAVISNLFMFKQENSDTIFANCIFDTRRLLDFVGGQEY